MAVQLMYTIFGHLICFIWQKGKGRYPSLEIPINLPLRLYWGCLIDFGSSPSLRPLRKLEQWGMPGMGGVSRTPTQLYLDHSTEGALGRRIRAAAVEGARTKGKLR